MTSEASLLRDYRRIAGRYEMRLQTQRACRLTASKFAEHACDGAARPAKASIAPKPNTRLAGSVAKHPGRAPASC